ncbi:hypothetical protein QF035_010156 [Streptomyces umbrinus]|uniref:Ion transport domain-containing protein n=1 Tax=Streptomyces umbrinus TaxID=67370 RepID=A0ABU0TCQ7_9ACTN|nr:hypothetical protein [Streptomyces umbrinus]
MTRSAPVWRSPAGASASYVLLASFVLVNVLIGVVISSLDEARELEREQELLDEEARRPAGPLPAVTGEEAGRELRERIMAARRALDDLESSLRRFPGPAPGGDDAGPDERVPVTAEGARAPDACS